MDYSIHDAIEAGFNKIVFIIRKDIKDAFKEAIGDWCYHLFKPPYQYVMHIDTGDYRRTDRTSGVNNHLSGLRQSREALSGSYAAAG